MKRNAQSLLSEQEGCFLCGSHQISYLSGLSLLRSHPFAPLIRYRSL
jgi:hypothetical protein